MTTLTDYLLVNRNLATYQKLVAADPVVKARTQYYKDHISGVKTPEDLVGNYRLFSCALTAFGLGDRVNQTALFKKVLAQSPASPRSLARTLHDSRILAFAKAFDFGTYGGATGVTKEASDNVVAKYLELTLEDEQGKLNPGVELALYFQHNAPTVTGMYGVLADKKLLEVVQTALGISPLSSGASIDTQYRLLSGKLDVKDFKDPAKLERFIQRFAANYDLNNGGPSLSNGGAALALISGAAADDGSGNAGNRVLSALYGAF